MPRVNGKGSDMEKQSSAAMSEAFDPLSDCEGVIELAIPTVTRPYRARLASAVISTARMSGYRVNVVAYQDDYGLSANDYLETRRGACDGMLLYLVGGDEVNASAFRQPFPIVCLGLCPTSGNVDQVLADNVADARNITDLVIRKGSRRLVLLGAQHEFDGRSLDESVRSRGWDRVRGVLEACREHGIALDPRLIGVTGYEWTIGAGYSAMKRVASSGVEFDGVICMDDPLAIGAVFALKELGRSIPDDVQVVGFDNIYDAAHMVPSLTTVDANLEWITGTAVDLLARRMHDPSGEPLCFQRESPILLRQSTR